MRPTSPWRASPCPSDQCDSDAMTVILPTLADRQQMFALTDGSDDKHDEEGVEHGHDGRRER